MLAFFIEVDLQSQGSSQEADSWEKIQGENVEKMNVFQW